MYTREYPWRNAWTMRHLLGSRRAYADYVIVPPVEIPKHAMPE